MYTDDSNTIEVYYLPTQESKEWSWSAGGEGICPSQSFSIPGHWWSCYPEYMPSKVSPEVLSTLSIRRGENKVQRMVGMVLRVILGEPEQTFWPSQQHTLLLLTSLLSHMATHSYQRLSGNVARLRRRRYQSLSHVRLFVIPCAVARQAPLSVGFSRQEYWSRLPFPSPRDIANPGIEPRSPALQADSLPSELPRKPRLGTQEKEGISVSICHSQCGEMWKTKSLLTRLSWFFRIIAQIDI